LTGPPTWRGPARSGLFVDVAAQLGQGRADHPLGVATVVELVPPGELVERVALQPLVEDAELDRGELLPGRLGDLAHRREGVGTMATATPGGQAVGQGLGVLGGPGAESGLAPVQALGHVVADDVGGDDGQPVVEALVGVALVPRAEQLERPAVIPAQAFEDGGDHVADVVLAGPEPGETPATADAPL